MRNAETRTPQEAVLSRLWELDAEYERLKAALEDDHKLILSALKQQADLLAQIAKHAAGGGEESEVEAERTDPDAAVRELRELYRKLGPVIGV